MATSATEARQSLVQEGQTEVLVVSHQPGDELLPQLPPVTSINPPPQGLNIANKPDQVLLASPQKSTSQLPISSPPHTYRPDSPDWGLSCIIYRMAPVLQTICIIILVIDINIFIWQAFENPLATLNHNEWHFQFLFSVRSVCGFDEVHIKVI